MQHKCAWNRWSSRRVVWIGAQYRYSWCGAAINARWWNPLLCVKETALKPQDYQNPCRACPGSVHHLFWRLSSVYSPPPPPKKRQPTMADFSSLLGTDFTFTSIMHECQWMQWINAKQNNKSCIPRVLPALSNAGERIECHCLLGKTSYFCRKAGLIASIEQMSMFPFLRCSAASAWALLVLAQLRLLC